MGRPKITLIMPKVSTKNLDRTYREVMKNMPEEELGSAARHMKKTVSQ